MCHQSTFYIETSTEEKKKHAQIDGDVDVVLFMFQRKGSLYLSGDKVIFCVVSDIDRKKTFVDLWYST